MMRGDVIRFGRVVVASSLVLLGFAGRASAQPAPPARPQPSEPEPARDPAWQTDDPAKAADPPLIPAPHSQSTTSPSAMPPLSTSGTDVATGEQGGGPAVVGGETAESARRDAQMKALELRIAADERRIRRLDERTKVWKHLRFESFIQPQLLIQSYNTAASPNRQANGDMPEGVGANDVTARPDGSTTNGTFFRLRRTRLRTFYDTDIAKLFLQLDVLPAGGAAPGIGTIVRNAEATGIARWTKDVRTEVTAGMFFTPFRAELIEISMVRPFIERTWFVQNVFPIERDIGVHAKTFAFGDRLVFDFAVVNGQRLGERHFVSTPDLNKSKDLVSFLTYRMGPVTVGVNGYLGRGQVIDAQNLRFKQFSKWAVNYQAVYRQRLVRRLGETRAFAELALTQNMDTGINYAFAVPRIPTNLRDDVGNVDGRALYLRAEQDLSPWLMAGYRYDMYTPDTAIANNARDTHAFLTVVRFSQHLRWMNELSWAIDNVHPTGAPPPSKHIVAFSSVLQAGF
jgi:hypothetical protein